MQRLGKEKIWEKKRIYNTGDRRDKGDPSEAEEGQRRAAGDRKEEKG